MKKSFDLFSLTGSLALVTGCAGGIGSGLALGLAQAGATVIGLDITDMQETSQRIAQEGGTFYGYQVDLSIEEALKSCWDQVLVTHKTIDIVVNNAGTQYRSPASEFPLDAFDKVHAINMRVPYQLSQLAVQHFLSEKKKGKIINIASLFSTFGGMNVSAYTCSKHGVLGMTKAFSNEYAGKGINVNAIAPGYIATEITKSIWSDSVKSELINQRIPLGRWGEPQDFIGVGVFLASRASDYISGVVIPVDGGYTVR